MLICSSDSPEQRCIRSDEGLQRYTIFKNFIFHGSGTLRHCTTPISSGKRQTPPDHRGTPTQAQLSDFGMRTYTPSEEGDTDDYWSAQGAVLLQGSDLY